MLIQAGRIALAGAAAIAMSVPLVATASAMSYDRHEVARAQIAVRATAGQLALAKTDVLKAGGQVVRLAPAINGFVAQVPITSVAGLRKASGIASVVILGPLLQQ